MLYTGVPRKRRKAVPGGNKVACGVCGIPGLSLDMRWKSSDGPGRPATRALVHPECDDKPTPELVARIRATRPPWTQQSVDISQTTPSDAITVTTAVFVATSTTTATIAQVTADPTVSLGGTGFTTKTYGRIHHRSTGPERRATTYVSASNITFELEAQDFDEADTIYVGAVKIDAGTLVSAGIALTIT